MIAWLRMGVELIRHPVPPGADARHAVFHSPERGFNHVRGGTLCPIALLTAGRTNRDAGTGSGGETVTGFSKRRALSGIPDAGPKKLPARQTVFSPTYGERFKSAWRAPVLQQAKLSAQPA